MPAKLANCSNISRQLKETSGVGKNKNDARRTWGVFVFFFGEKKPYMPAKLANGSNISRQLKETSGIGASTARPTIGEAASPWQAMSV